MQPIKLVIAGLILANLTSCAELGGMSLLFGSDGTVTVQAPATPVTIGQSSK